MTHYGKTAHGQVWHKVTVFFNPAGPPVLAVGKWPCGFLFRTEFGATITTELPPGARKCRRCWKEGK